MSTVGYVQLVFLVIGFISGFILPVAATVLLERREKRFVTSWYSESHPRNSELERSLASKVRLGSRVSFLCAAVIVALWAIKNF
jgi:hypothetical protein